ncbi:MAG: YeeE/YedE thiosulfate transporter family protein [Burkholderiales bacterium]|nr:YeeE/YedE thiosulfate transporter family protein [Burkholderiales bacterium]
MIKNSILHRVSEFLVGLLFGLGLILSGMTDPGKVTGFLDLFGLWDPSLALVMGGAIAVGFFAFTLAKKRTTNFFGGMLRLPAKNQIDKPLIIGSLLFGAGWGLAGFCPGPALVSMASGQPKALVFVLAMLAGMVGFELMDRFIHAPRKAALNPH